MKACQFAPCRAVLEIGEDEEFPHCDADKWSDNEAQIVICSKHGQTAPNLQSRCP